MRNEAGNLPGSKLGKVKTVQSPLPLLPLGLITWPWTFTYSENLPLSIAWILNSWTWHVVNTHVIQHNSFTKWWLHRCFLFSVDSPFASSSIHSMFPWVFQTIRASKNPWDFLTSRSIILDLGFGGVSDFETLFDTNIHVCMYSYIHMIYYVFLVSIATLSDLTLLNIK